MIGDRIRQVRLAAGLTQDEVVKQLELAGLKITKAALSKYELDKSEPKQSFLVLLGRILKVKPAYFLTKPTVTITWLAFRKQSTLSQAKQDRIRAFVEMVVEKQSSLNDLFYPEQQSSFPKPTQASTNEDAESIAHQLRKTWRLDHAPIDSLVETVEDKGGFVVEYPQTGIKFDGLSGRFGNRPVIVINSESSVDRYRYNVAHELGHLMMNCSTLTPKEEEGLAHRFAAALLVPADIARKELGVKRRDLSFAELGVLKEKYGLSMQAWTRRARDLEIISESLYKSLCINFSSNKWRKNEPVQYSGHEKPKRLLQMTLRAVAEGIITKEEASRICKNCGTAPLADGKRKTGNAMSPIELLKLPREERAKILADAAALAEKDYQENKDLTDFNAFGEDDLYVEGEEAATETR